MTSSARTNKGRRDFLKKALIVSSVPFARMMPVSAFTRKHVIVIGAGMAGLAAAKKLADAGH